VVSNRECLSFNHDNLDIFKLLGMILTSFTLLSYLHISRSPELSLNLRFALTGVFLGNMVNPVWWRQGDEVHEHEVIVYAFIVLKALFPVKRPRKRGLGEAVNLDSYSSVSNLFQQNPPWWQDIADALKTHPLTKDLLHLHNPNGLNNWFVKTRDMAKFSGRTFRDTQSANRWKAYLLCDVKRGVLEAHLGTAQEPQVELPRPPPATKVAPRDWKDDYEQQAGLLRGQGQGKIFFDSLYDKENDENFTHFDPLAIMQDVEDHCPLLHQTVSMLVTGPRDSENKIRTPEYKLMQGFTHLAAMCRVRSTHAVPVFAIFMAIVFFACATNRSLIDAKAASGSCATMRTLNKFLDARGIAQTSEAMYEQRYPIIGFIMGAYDNYVRGSRRIKHQRLGRHTHMIVGTMRAAGNMLVPPNLDFEAVAGPCALDTVTLQDVLSIVSTDDDDLPNFDLGIQ
jgi:hypothetical protein